jgi:hypothetical protein
MTVETTPNDVVAFANIIIVRKIAGPRTGSIPLRQPHLPSSLQQYHRHHADNPSSARKQSACGISKPIQNQEAKTRF